MSASTAVALLSAAALAAHANAAAKGVPQGSLLEHLLNFLEPVKMFLQNADALGEIVQTFLLSVRDSAASASAIVKSPDHRGYV